MEAKPLLSVVDALALVLRFTRTAGVGEKVVLGALVTLKSVAIGGGLVWLVVLEVAGVVLAEKVKFVPPVARGASIPTRVLFELDVMLVGTTVVESTVVARRVASPVVVVFESTVVLPEIVVLVSLAMKTGTAAPPMIPSEDVVKSEEVAVASVGKVTAESTVVLRRTGVLDSAAVVLKPLPVVDAGLPLRASSGVAVTLGETTVVSVGKSTLGTAIMEGAVILVTAMATGVTLENGVRWDPVAATGMTGCHPAEVRLDGVGV